MIADGICCKCGQSITPGAYGVTPTCNGEPVCYDCIPKWALNRKEDVEAIGNLVLKLVARQQKVFVDGRVINCEP